MGQVLGAFGVVGWVKLRTFTAGSDNLLGQPTWWLAPPGTPEEEIAAFRAVTVSEARVHGADVVAKLSQVDDRDAAASLRGTVVAVPRASLPEGDRDEFYWADLIGLAVFNRKGESLGEITGLIETGAHDVLRLRASDGVERLVPFVATYVDTVDLSAGRVLVDWDLDY